MSPKPKITHQDLDLADQLAKAMPPIPLLIGSRQDFEISTIGLVWNMPPPLVPSKLQWESIRTTPELRRVMMGYVAMLLAGKSERYAVGEYIQMGRVKDWTPITETWESKGVIDLACVLAIRRQLEEAFPKPWKLYFGTVKRLCLWACGMRVPGFTQGLCDDLGQLKGSRTLSFLAQVTVAPGATRTRPTKNRRAYGEHEFPLMAAYFLSAEGQLRAGRTLFRHFREGEIQREEGFHGFGRINGVLMRPSVVGLRHLVVAWLAWSYGDRPEAFTKLRESHFEFFEADGVQCAHIRMPRSKQKHGDYRAIQGPLSLNEHLIRLVPELIKENRAQRERLGIDQDQDWLLFPVTQEGPGVGGRKKFKVFHEDPAMNVRKSSCSLLQDLKLLFEVLRIPDGQGGVIIPTFYSFRDGNVTNWIARGLPPNMVAEIHGKKSSETLNHYNKPGVTFVGKLDEIPEYEALAAAFAPNQPVHQNKVPPAERVPEPAFLDIDGEGTFMGFTGRCGCIGSKCPIAMNGSIDCYLCPTFQATFEGPHEKVMDKLWDRRKTMLSAGLPEREYTRYDRHIVACGEVVRRIRAMMEVSE